MLPQDAPVIPVLEYRQDVDRSDLVKVGPDLFGVSVLPGPYRVLASPQKRHTNCVLRIPIARAAPLERSSVTLRVNGPRSLTTTVTDNPFCGLLTVSCDPKGSVRCAAVIPRDANACPLAVRRPPE
jgi:hypothetical protein